MSKLLRRFSYAIIAGLPLTGFAITTPEVVITPNRIPQKSNQVAASTTVITREQIESAQYTSIPDLLRGVVGIDLVQNGGPGKISSVFMRGTESDHVLVLVNGLRVGSASLGTTAFELIPVEHIESIEIVRGPRASQWGSEAIGGVIHIFTRKGNGSNAYEIGAGVGSFNTATGHASVAGESNGTHYQASVAYYDTDGFDTRQPIPGPFGFDQPDDDSYDNLSFHLRGGHEFDSGFNIDAFILRADGTTEFDGSFQDETDFVQQILGAEAHWQGENWGIKFKAGESRDETENFSPDGSFASRFDTKRLDTSLIGDIQLIEDHQLIGGVDYRDDKVDSDTTFNETSRDNLGLFAQYLGSLGNNEFTASIRNDDNEAFGKETTGGVGWVYNTNNAIKIYASWGTAFKTPTFNELFFPGFGNPNLEPETSESYEIGLEGAPGWGFWGIHAFRTDIDDLIVTTFDPVTGSFAPENVDRARINGYEAQIGIVKEGWQASASITLLDHEDRMSGNKLARRPDTSLTIDITKIYERLRIGGRLIAQDDRFDDSGNTIEVDGFVTLDLYADFEVTPGLFIRGRVNNLFDKEYETASTFNSADRNFMISILYKSRP